MACSCTRNSLNGSAGRCCCGRGASSRRRGRIRCGDSGATARNAAALSAEMRGAKCAESLASTEKGRSARSSCTAVADELYGGVKRKRSVRTTCCDPCGCGYYNIADRDPFWPTFARPRWLSCDSLYSRGRR